MPNTYSNQYTKNPAWQRVREIDEQLAKIREKSKRLYAERVKAVGEIYGKNADHNSGRRA